MSDSPVAQRLVRSQFAALTLAVVASQNQTAAAKLAQNFGLTFPLPGETQISLSLAVLRALADAAEKETGDLMLGLSMCFRLQRGMFGVLEFSVRSAGTLREALNRLVRYTLLLNEFMVIEVTEKGSLSILEQRIDGEPLCLGRHGNEFSLATIVHNSRELSGESVHPQHVWFAHEAPSSSARQRLVEFFGTSKIEFNAGANGFAINRDVLSARVKSADPSLLSLLDGIGATLVANMPERVDAGDDVKQAIRDRLSFGTPNLSTIAKSMGMSARTLQRRVGPRGFQKLVDDVREEMARRYINNMAPIDIAYLLGYSDLRAFLRAFRRWTGTTPSALRKSTVT